MAFEDTPNEESRENLKPNVLAEKLKEEYESDVFRLLTKVPEEDRQEIADALADFSHNLAESYSGNAYPSEENKVKSKELIEKLKGLS